MPPLATHSDCLCRHVIVFLTEDALQMGFQSMPVVAERTAEPLGSSLPWSTLNGAGVALVHLVC